MEKRNAFRKRSNAVLRSGSRDCHYHVKEVGENSFVSLVIADQQDEIKLPLASPTLDQQLNAGVSVKEVNTQGILDSYDVNDTPLEQLEEKIVTKGRKTKKDKEVENE